MKMIHVLEAPTKLLYIVRGIPGSGKSTLSKELVGYGNHIESDMFFMVDGEYKFDVSKLSEAHAWCKDELNILMEMGNTPLAISNTSTKREYYQPYIDLAEEQGYDVMIIDCYSSWVNSHEVPEDVLDDMKEAWTPHSN